MKTMINGSGGDYDTNNNNCGTLQPCWRQRHCYWRWSGQQTTCLFCINYQWVQSSQRWYTTWSWWWCTSCWRFETGCSCVPDFFIGLSRAPLTRAKWVQLTEKQRWKIMIIDDNDNNDEEKYAQETRRQAWKAWQTWKAVWETWGRELGENSNHLKLEEKTDGVYLWLFTLRWGTESQWKSDAREFRSSTAPSFSTPMSTVTRFLFDTDQHCDLYSWHFTLLLSFFLTGDQHEGDPVQP